MVIKKDNGISSFFTNVYAWMVVGLLVSGITAYYTSINQSLLSFVYKAFTLLLILEIVVVIVFSFLRKKTNPSLARVMFIIYSLLNGFTLSSIFLYFKIGSVIVVFISAALMFLLLAVYGYVTKTDLSSIGKIFIFALIAIIIMSIINMFLGNGSFGIFISIVSIVVFLGLTAWDMQKLKAIYSYYKDDEKELKTSAIYGALDLYLDFINIFLDLLNLFGKQK